MSAQRRPRSALPEGPSPTLGEGPSGPLQIDLERLIETRLLVQGSSGAGKSRAVRRILEQTHGRVQQIVLDVEDEYASLRERFDFVLGGPGRDFPVTVASAALLARRLLELGVSAVLNLNDLEGAERAAFVAAFLSAMLAAPQVLWHDVLVVIEEADTLAPEGGRAAATKAVSELMGRGRKRGFCGVVACRRISDVAKSVVALAQNRMIGQTTLDADVKRAAYELGFSGRDASRRLVEIPQGHFYCYGPALSREVVQVQIGALVTTHGRQRGKRAGVTPPAPAAVRQILAQLADLPAEAQAEADHVRQLEATIDRLEGALLKQQQSAERVSESELQEACALAESLRDQLDRSEKAAAEARAHMHAAVAVLGNPTPQSQPLSEEPADLAPAPSPARANLHRREKPTPGAGGIPCSADSTQLAPRQTRVLDAIQSLAPYFDGQPPRELVAPMAGTGHWVSTFDRDCGAMRMAGWIEYRAPGTLSLTAKGEEAAEGRAVTQAELHAAVLSRLAPRQARIVRALLHVRGQAMTREALAEAAGTSATVSTFDRDLGWLRASAGLLEYPAPGRVRAEPKLFLRAAR